MKKSVTISVLVLAFLMLMNVNVKSQCQNPLVPNIIANGPVNFCEGGSVVLDAGPYLIYFWSTGETNETIIANQNQNYCVTVTDGNGCTGIACITITVFPNPLPLIFHNGPTTFCVGGSVVLNTTSFYAYQWSNGSNTPAINVNTSGDYTVTVSTIKGCTGTAQQTVTVNQPPTPVITPNGPTTFCLGGSVILDAGVYANYNWSNGATTQSITTFNPGTYSVTVFMGPGCMGGTSQVVDVLPPIASPVIMGNTSFCPGGSTTLTTTTYNSYIWSTGETTQSILVTTPGIYSLTVSNGGGCTASLRRTVTLLTAPVPVIAATNLSNLCANMPANLNVVGTYPSYLWSNGFTTQGIIVPLAGTYSVTVRSTNGCLGISSYTINNSGCVIPANAPTPTTNITATTAMANWIQPLCYYNYTIRISKHGANSWTAYTVAPNTHYTFSGLAHNTVYDWQIKTNCNASASVNSGYSLPQTFTTLSRLEANENDNTITSFNVYPNPASNQITVTYPSTIQENFNIRLVDILGNSVLSYDNYSNIGENQVQVNLADVSKGVYILMLQNGTNSVQRKVVVQ